MTWIEKYIAERSAKDREFQSAFEAEAAILSLIRAREKAKMTQADVAAALHVSQPYIAQIERGSRPISLLFMTRYAGAVGVKVKIVKA